MAAPTSNTISSEAAADDDTFTLHDLRVEVICPPGKRIMCGAKPGDHFTLQGEMLHLPAGQGFSIYSLGMYLSLISSAQTIRQSICCSPDWSSRPYYLTEGMSYQSSHDVNITTTIIIRATVNGQENSGSTASPSIKATKDSCQWLDVLWCSRRMSRS